MRVQSKWLSANCNNKMLWIGLSYFFSEPSLPPIRDLQLIVCAVLDFWPLAAAAVNSYIYQQIASEERGGGNTTKKQE